jgi:hypothetical protein
VEVPAAEIDRLRPGNQVYDDLLRQAQEAGSGGIAFLPDELTFPPLPQRVPQVKWSHSTMYVEEGVTDPDIEFLKARADEVVELPRRVPQVPSDIAEAGITRGGLQFPTDVPEDVFHAAQTAECGWALVDNAGTFVCNLPADHGNNHSDGGRAWYDSGTDDCTCAIRGSGPDTYACPEHPADARCALPVHVLYPGDDINISTAYCEKAANHGDVHAGGGFAWSYDELEITAPQPR